MIFGFEHSKMVYNNIDYELAKSILLPDFSISDFKTSTSPFTGKRTWIGTGEYSSFTVVVNNYKNVDPKTSFETLYLLRHELVKFYPHKDGQAIKDQAGNDCLFIVESIKPFFREDNMYGYLHVILHSVGYSTLDGLYNILGYGYQFSLNYGYGF